MRAGIVLLVVLLIAGCGAPHLQSKTELAHEAKQKAATDRQKAINEYHASEEFRAHQRCVGHDGIQQLMPEVAEGDDGTSVILVVCKDGAGPFQELTDSYNATR